METIYESVHENDLGVVFIDKSESFINWKIINPRDKIHPYQKSISSKLTLDNFQISSVVSMWLRSLVGKVGVLPNEEKQ
jgi:hypothetical protein